MEKNRKDKGEQGKDGKRKVREAGESAEQDWERGAAAGLAVTDVKAGYSSPPLLRPLLPLTATSSQSFLVF